MAVRQLALLSAVAFLLLGFDPNEPFDRGRFGGWEDADGDCQDTRAEVLIRESEIPVTFRGQKECVVIRGRWTDPYTGRAFTAAAAMELDTTVPLEDAHTSGVLGLGNREKGEYLNDLTPGHLWVVHVSTVVAKNGRPIAEYKPRKEFWCEYAAAWYYTKMRWSLSMDAPDVVAISEMIHADDPNTPCAPTRAEVGF